LIFKRIIVNLLIKIKLLYTKYILMLVNCWFIKNMSYINIIGYRSQKSQSLRLNQVEVRVDGWMPLTPLSVDKVGTFFRYAKADVEKPSIFVGVGQLYKTVNVSCCCFLDFMFVLLDIRWYRDANVDVLQFWL